jgi:hypothetical protein
MFTGRFLFKQLNLMSQGGIFGTNIACGMPNVYVDPFYRKEEK